MTTEKITLEATFLVHLKSGDAFEAVSSFDVDEITNDGEVISKSIFKAWDVECEEYYIVTTETQNIEYIEESYTDDIWERLLNIAGMEPTEDTTATDLLFG